MKDVKVDKFVKLLDQGKSAIEASKEADIDNYTIDEVNSPVYLCTICVKQNMFDYDMDKVKKLFGEIEDDKF